MADVPLYDPNDFGRCDPEVRRNRAVTDLYEPGSTFKAIAVAGAHTNARTRANSSKRENFCVFGDVASAA